MTTASRIRVLLLCATAAIPVLATIRGTFAQAPPLPYQLRMTRDRLEAMRQVWNDRLPAMPGEVLVKFRAGVDNVGRTAALSAARPDIGPQGARWIGDVLWIRSTAEPDAERLARVLQRQPEVEWAQPNRVRWIKARPNDPAYSRQWNLDLIDMPRAWDINNGSSQDVIVAVIDTGVTAVTETFGLPLWTGASIETVDVPFRVNPDIAASRILPGQDFIFWDGPVLDMVGHGTHVAGTVLQETNNNLALAGIAHRARLLPLKACVGYWELQIARSAAGIPGEVDLDENGFCDDASGAQAVRFAADNGARIINLSLGGPGESPVYLDALRYAVSRGVFAAIAAGNEFEDGNPTEYPAAYGAQIDGVMAVGAVGRSSRRAFYSNTGPHLEIVAPGGDVTDGALAGVIYQTSMVQDDLDQFQWYVPRFDRYTEVPGMGTSMAAPHVAGVAALLYSQGITRPAAVEQALKRFARDLGTAGRDNDFGHGLIDARASLRGLGVAR